MQLAEQVLYSPDVVYAAVIMHQHNFSNGRGDFHQIFKLLSNNKDHRYLDIANKLLLIRTGCLFKFGKWPSLSDKKSEGYDPLMVPILEKEGKEVYKIYQDEVPKGIRKKHLFRIWKEWLCC